LQALGGSFGVGSLQDGRRYTGKGRISGGTRACHSRTATRDQWPRNINLGLQLELFP
jgi:hypothetical protein